MPVYKTKRQGISLLEVTLSTGILLIVALLSYSIIIQLSKGQNYILEHTSSAYQAQNAMNTMVKELREAALSDTGAYPIEQATNTSITFYSDVDTDNAREKITYTLVGTTLNRVSIEPTGQPIQYRQSDAKTQILTENVINSGPIFTYFNGGYPIDASNNPLNVPADVSQIRLIHIRLEVNPRPLVAPQSTLIQSDVQLRNLKNNLAD